METPNSNTQTAPIAPTPAAAEPSPAELQAKIAELEKQSEGRLRDLQAERAKRQELESRMPPPAAASSPVADPDVMQDELGKVINPYIQKSVKPLLDKVKQAEAFVANTYRDKALEHLAAKTGKSKEAVMNDSELDNKLTSIVKRYGFQGNVYDVTVRACEIMELENLKEKEAERKRAASAGATASLPTGNASPVSNAASKEYSEEEFNAMPLHEYDKLSGSGSFAMNKEGKVVFTPSSK